MPGIVWPLDTLDSSVGYACLSLLWTRGEPGIGTADGAEAPALPVRGDGIVLEDWERTLDLHANLRNMKSQNALSTLPES